MAAHSAVFLHVRAVLTGSRTAVSKRHGLPLSGRCGTRTAYRPTRQSVWSSVWSSAWCGVWSATTHSGPEPARRRRHALRRNRERPRHSPSYRPDGRADPNAPGRRCRAIALIARRRRHEAVGGLALCTRHRSGAETAVSALSLRLRHQGDTRARARFEVSSVTALKGAARTER